MADHVDFRDVFPVEDAPASVGLGTLTNWLGAILSLSLMIGLGFWGYRLAMRDVTGVPVVRAMGGPMRVQPDDPGGETAAYQGLAVNTVPSKGGVAPPADRVVLAPPPVKLDSNEDLTVAALEPGKPTRQTAGLREKPRNVADVSASSAEMDIENAIKLAVRETTITRRAAQLSHLPGVKRSPRPRARLRTARLASAGASMPVAPESQAGNLPDAARRDGALKAGVPILPPARLASRQGMALTTAPTTASATGPAVAPGASLVQLGAFDSRQTAQREWKRIRKRHADLIGERSALIQQAESGGRPFYRLRLSGFRSLDDSRRLCAALVARGTPCIPVIAR